MQYPAAANVITGMNASTALESAVADPDRQVSAIVARERGRLSRFVRRWVSNPGDVEDIVQDVFFELVEAARMPRPIEEVGAWLFRVARNRIIDRFRRNRLAGAREGEAGGDHGAEDSDGESVEDLLPSPQAGPEALYARRLLLEEIEAALDELAPAQREVFVQHEIEGRSFRELADETGVSINTLLARKRYAVLHLRKRLREIDWTVNGTGG